MAALGPAITTVLGPDVRDEFPAVPEARRVVAPDSIEQASQILRTASTHRLSTVVWGGGTHQGLGYPVDPDIVVVTSRLARIIDWQPDDLTIVVEAGMRVDALEAQLTVRGQSAVLPEVPGDATIGGVIASGTSGWRRLRYGPTRDRLLEVVVATGDGRIVTGGGRVVKNVTGYDVPRLMVGSLGTLGLIGRVCLKLWPMPAHSATIAVDDAAAACRVAFRPLAVIETDDTSAVFVAGTEEEIAGQASDLGGSVAPGLAWPSPIESPWRLSLRVPPSNVVQAVDQVRGLGHTVRFQASHGVGIITIGLDTFDVDTAGSLRAWAERIGGALVLEQAPGDGTAWDPWGRPPPSLELQRRVKAGFDPAAVMNPGRLPGRL